MGTNAAAATADAVAVAVADDVAAALAVVAAGEEFPPRFPALRR
jgi:hypothetical protein